MAKGYPSLTALLALLAVAGYRNRDAIADMLNGKRQTPTAAPPPHRRDPKQALNEIFGNLRRAANGVGNLLRDVRELLDHFEQRAGAKAAESWGNRGPQPLSPHQLREVLGAYVLSELSRRMGISEQEILNRLSQRTQQQ